LYAPLPLRGAPAIVSVRRDMPTYAKIVDMAGVRL